MTQIRLRLKLAILASGRKQEDIAKECGIFAPVLSNIVRGRVLPTEAEKERIAAALHLPVSRLFSNLTTEEITGIFYGSEQAEKFAKLRMRRTR